MIKRVIYLALIAAMLAAPILPTRVATAAPDPDIFLAPGEALPGAEIMVSGYGYEPFIPVTLFLDPSGLNQDLGEFFADESGVLHASFILPALSPGFYDILAASSIDVVTSINVLPALTLDLGPTGGPPGTTVHFSVNNLVAGQLRLDYAGIPIFGPVDVTAGIFEGDFLVPADRPASFPQDAAVSAFNTIGNQTIGSAHTFFVAETPLWPIYNSPEYAIQITEFPPSPVAPGYPFTLQGIISPPPQGPLNLYELKLLWKSGTGQIVPITVGTPQLLSNGSFTITGHAPSLFGGDPLLPNGESGGKVGVIFINKQGGSSSTAGFAPWLDPPYPVFKVKVVDENGSPIQGAIVDVRAFYSSPKEITSDTDGGIIMQNQLNNLEMHPNQITNFLGAYSPSQSDPFSCELTNTYGRTDINGEFEVKIEPEMLAILGKKTYIKNGNQSGYMEVPLDIDFPLFVNATFQGFGKDGLPEPFEMQIHFSGTSHWFYDAEKNIKLDTDPLVVSLKSLPAGTKITAPIVPKVKDPGTIHDAALVLGGFKDYLGLHIPMTAFGNFYSFPLSQFPDAWFPYSGQIDIEFEYDPALFGPLDEENMKFTLEGTTYPFDFYYKKSSGQEGCEIIKYRAKIPTAHRLSPGKHTGLIEIRDTAAVPNITKHYIQLNFISAPTWILDAKYKAREINLFGTHIVMHGYQFPAGGPNSTSNLDTDVPKIGPLANNVSFQDDVQQTLYPDHTSGITYTGRSDTTVVDEDAPSKGFNSSVAGGTEIQIPASTVTVLDTGKIPIYRHVIGIYPIAGATLGADMWIDATLTTSGVIEFFPAGGTSTTMLVFPKATVGVDAFLDASILFGLVSASAHAKPNIGLGMPASFVDGTLTDNKRCFLYQLTLSWEAKTGICPFCLIYSDSDEIFDGSNPSPCTVPKTAATSLAQDFVTATTPQPPTSSPSIAVDGFGHTMMVWSDANNNIQSRLMSGGQTVGEYTVSSSMGSIDPQVSFFAPNKAVAVWTESSLGSSQNATLEQLIQAQHLKYALWDGASSSWGTAQNLTAPSDSNGEGKVVLAGCLSTTAGCPAGGQVTAVWVRDMGAAYSERNFRLFFSAFNGTSWSDPAPVDPSSTGTDAEATLAYAPTGLAQLVWARDPDRSLSTATDRLLYHRQLSIGSPVTPLTALPNTAVEPSLAVNNAGELVLAFTVATDPLAFMGNQRQLHAAKQSCGGSGCTWSYNALVDPNGRPVHAESPTITVNSSGQAQITYRALGFGPANPGGPAALPGDPLGTLLGTGEIAQTFVSLTPSQIGTIVPSYLTTSGQTVWQTNAVFDPLFKQVYAVGSLGSGPTLSSAAKELLSTQGYEVDGLTEVTEPLTFAVASAQPDFSVSDVMLSTPYPQKGGEPLTVIVTVLNNGPAFSGGRSGDLVVKLAWDAPVGLGTPAGEMVIPFIDAGTLTGLEFSSDPGTGTLIAPAFPHLPHTLYVQVNPGRIFPESNYENNTRRISIGGLPSPQGLTGAAQAGDSSVFLEWQPVDHSAVAGYRVYRSSDGRMFSPVGSSFIPGFVDLTGVFGQSYIYRVVAYANDGFESEMSDPLEAVVGMTYPVFLPVIQR